MNEENKDIEVPIGKPQVANFHVVFVDIVKYSLRTAAGQEKIISAFTRLSAEAITHALESYSRNAQSSEDVIKLPTGDGLAIGAIPGETIDLHLRLVRALGKSIHEHNASIECDIFRVNGWCNCHPLFTVRIGASEGKAIIYTDINGRRNIAGTPINEAARIMGAADPMSALFSEAAFRSLTDFSHDATLRNLFRPYRGIEVKHGVELDAYQYLDPEGHLTSKSLTIQDRVLPQTRVYGDFPQVAIDLFEWITNMKKTLDVYMRDTRWAFALLPSLIKQRLHSKLIRVVCEPSSEPVEKQRIGLLVRMGCRVAFAPKNLQPEFPGIALFDANEEFWSRAIVFPARKEGTSPPIAVSYERGMDRVATRAFHDQFDTLWASSQEVSGNSKLEIKPISMDELVSRFRDGVPQYSNDHVRIELEPVRLDELWFLSSKLFQWKYRQISTVLDLYSIAQADYFIPLAVHFDADHFSIMTPPVIEEDAKGRLVVINGSHRLYHCRKTNLASPIKCIVVRGVSESLPGTPVRFEDVQLLDHEPAGNSRINNFDFGRFRHLERAIHPPDEVAVEPP